MLTVVIGGSASGKSEYAEGLILKSGLSRRVYVATMQPFDEECLRRIERHRKMRREKGFETVECYTGLKQAEIPEGSAVLLECMGNLAANELFAPHGAGPNALGEILAGIDHLCRRAEHCIVVTNDVFADGICYDADTRRYLELLGRVNACLGEKAQRVVEVVCGIPLWKKGGEA